MIFLPVKFSARQIYQILREVDVIEIVAVACDVEFCVRIFFEFVGKTFLQTDKPNFLPLLREELNHLGYRVLHFILRTNRLPRGDFSFPIRNDVKHAVLRRPMKIEHFAPHVEIREGILSTFAVARAVKLVENIFVLASQFLKINFVHSPRIKVLPSEMPFCRPILIRECSNGNRQQLFPS